MTSAQVREIAELKMPDLNAASVEAAMSMIAGTARSMGVVNRRLIKRYTFFYKVGGEKPKLTTRRKIKWLKKVKDMQVH